VIIPSPALKLRSTFRTGAFSLIELLVVIGIAAALMGLAGTAFFNMAKSTRVTTAGNQVLDALAQARQRAVTQNSRVEVRFYKLPAQSGQGADAFRGLRAVRIGQDGKSTDLERVVRLPDTVIISEITAQNTIFDATVEEKEDLNSEQKNVPYRAITFLPNGQTDLNLDPGQKWFLTLYDGQAAAQATDNLPDNYAVVQIDAFTGNARVLRPGN
jgi:uncharacterized protein (TIGR02596 family)